jgi:hypothetical protein
MIIRMTPVLAFASVLVSSATVTLVDAVPVVNVTVFDPELAE